ncbi:EscU/YscU/HrcU family type III secretion system export apparatus switch protein [Bacillus sp. FJAT-49711]|uniref:EscU/YscU/HrcU family type III secretion system export apparatus switch protein n=1 Tax=Bacillus sp. FJAT-49711 TaxID=2833585 RepID=UPI001BC9EEC5|nr:EscU/YscU/HrcU family type III secretion system export apparatus switch protein [Bacillus sp. FJAT-49711]MBS4219325.1 EscU/YscU/HrcU family type III secretion system export apparatus switch protein [Bacillus sp. FJAT-49711]
MMPTYFNQKNRRLKNGPSAAVIRYDESHDKAPQVVAHGTGAIATKIMELANEHGIMMQEDANLVGHLLDIDLGDNVPPQLYTVIAEILLLLEEMDRHY